MDVSVGQFRWSLMQTGVPPAVEDYRQGLALIGRSEQIDLSNGIISSYACQNCCLNSYYDSSLSPLSQDAEVGDVVPFYVIERDKNCYDEIEPPYVRTYIPGVAPWSSSNTQAATVDSSGTVTTIGAGDTTIQAAWFGRIYTSAPCGPGSPEKQTSCQGTKNSVIWINAPPCGACSYIDPFPHPSAGLRVVSVGNITYRTPGTVNYVDTGGTMYVLKGTTVDFKAIPNPSTATFRSGRPVWSGSSGATGTGPTTSVTFNTASSSLSDSKSIVATVRDASFEVTVIVYDLVPRLDIADNFSGRSVTTFGVGEIVDYYFAATPAVTAEQAGDLVWTKVSGSGVLSDPSNGIARYTHPDVAGTTTLHLTVQNGPSSGQYIATTIDTIAPSDASEVKSSNIAHEYGHVGGSFLADIYFSPTNVSFKRIKLIEGSVSASAMGYWAPFAGLSHIPNAFDIDNCNISTGCKVTVKDLVEQASVNAVTPPVVPGYFSWDIPWFYSSNSTSLQFTHAQHYATIVENGDISLRKQDAGPFPIRLTDGTTFH